MVDLNNSTGDWTTIWMNPYIHVLGDLFIPLVLIVIGAGIYVGTDKNAFITAVYFFGCALFFGPIFSLWITTIVCFIVCAIFAGIVYTAFIEKKPRY